MIAEPPVDAGAVKAIVAVPLPGVAVNIVGTSGAAMGVTETLPDATLSPIILTALMRTV